MSRKKITLGALLGGASLAVSSLSGLIIYPLLLKNCSKEIAGLWLFYTSFTVVLLLGQAGLAPIVMRRGAAVKVDGSAKAIASYLLLIKKSFRIVSLLVLAICVVIYFGYVHWVLLENSTIFYQGLVAWLFFVAGSVINISNSRNFFIINGFGEVGWDKFTQILITLFTLAGYFLALKLGWGLVGLSVVFFVGSLIYAVSSSMLLKRFLPLQVQSVKGDVSRNDLISIFKDGGQILVLNLVGILILNKDVFLVERFLGLTELPLFSALSRIQGIVISVSLMVPQMIFPFVSQSFSGKDYVRTHRLYLQGVFIAVGIAAFLSAAILIVANWAIPLWLGAGNYLGNTIMFLLLLIGIVTIHHNAHASAVISTGGSSFMWPAIINGALSLPLALLGIYWYGIEGMIIGNIIATVLPSIYVVGYSIKYFNSLKNAAQ